MPEHYVIGTLPDPNPDPGKQEETSIYFVDERIFASTFRFFSICVYNIDNEIFFTGGKSPVIARNGAIIEPFFNMHLEVSSKGIKWGLYEEISVHAGDNDEKTQKIIETKLKIFMRGLSPDEQIKLLEDIGMTRNTNRN